jgi:CrcB protein
MTLALVAAGGAIGAVLRYLAVLAAARLFGTGFPWGTLAVNFLGSLAIGILAVLMLERGGTGGRNLAPLLIPGLLGGFTTFSAFSLETVALIDGGRAAAAAAYAGASVGLCVAGAAAGLALARTLA